MSAKIEQRAGQQLLGGQTGQLRAAGWLAGSERSYVAAVVPSILDEEEAELHSHLHVVGKRRIAVVPWDMSLGVRDVRVDGERAHVVVVADYSAAADDRGIPAAGARHIRSALGRRVH